MGKTRKKGKYCMVPGCSSTSMDTPDKIFIPLPCNLKIRKLWQKAMHTKRCVNNQASLYCCEDHFNLEEDMENIIYYRTMKSGPVKLKHGVIPHIFKCQKRVLPKPQGLLVKQEKRIFVENFLIESIKSIGAQIVVEENSHKSTTLENRIRERKRCNNKSIQVALKANMRSKSIQCIFPPSSNQMGNNES